MNSLRLEISFFSAGRLPSTLQVLGIIILPFFVRQRARGYVQVGDGCKVVLLVCLLSISAPEYAADKGDRQCNLT